MKYVPIKTEYILITKSQISFLVGKFDDPIVCAESDSVADCEVDARVPVNYNEQVDHNLAHLKKRIQLGNE